MKRRVLALSALIALASGCAAKQFRDSSLAEMQDAAGSAGVSASAPAAAMEGRAAVAEKLAPDAEAPARTPGASATLASFERAEQDRYLIRNATVTLEVGDVGNVLESINAMVSAGRGYSSETHETIDGLGVRSVTLTVRIPAEKFDAGMNALAGWGRVIDRQVTSEDVTEEFVDSTSRLRNLKRTEERLLEHLKKTGKLSDTLLVEKELNRIRQEIEQLEGRLRFLKHRVVFCTITITLRETARPRSTDPVASFSAKGEMNNALRELIGFGRAAVATIIWWGVWSVVWVPTAVVVVLLLRRMGLRMPRRSKEKAPPSVPV
jgi:hypothetical protein